MTRNKVKGKNPYSLQMQENKPFYTGRKGKRTQYGSFTRAQDGSLELLEIIRLGMGDGEENLVTTNTSQPARYRDRAYP